MPTTRPKGFHGPVPMIAWTFILIAAALLPGRVPAAGPDESAAQPATKPQTASTGDTAESDGPETRPAETRPVDSHAEVDPKAMKVLRALEVSGEEYRTLKADVRHRYIDRLTGDIETRTGWVGFRKGKPPKPDTFRIEFKTLKQGREGPTVRDRLVYAFDGRWLSVLKYRIKQLTRYQVAAKGQRIEPLRLGKGPFPVPFGQKVEDVLKYFNVTTREPKESDPPETDYISLLTRPPYRRELSFLVLEIWVDRDTHLPVRILSREGQRLRKITKITTVRFSDVEGKVELDEEMFHPPKPGLGWSTRVEPLKGDIR